MTSFEFFYEKVSTCLLYEFFGTFVIAFRVVRNYNYSMSKQAGLIIASILLGIALLPLPYGYYQFLRIAVFSISIWALVESHNKNTQLPIGLFFTAIIYNPIFKISLDREIWSAINIITIVYFVYLIMKQKDK